MLFPLNQRRFPNSSLHITACQGIAVHGAPLPNALLSSTFSVSRWLQGDSQFFRKLVFKSVTPSFIDVISYELGIWKVEGPEQLKCQSRSEKSNSIRQCWKHKLQCKPRCGFTSGSVKQPLPSLKPLWAAGVKQSYLKCINKKWWFSVLCRISLLMMERDKAYAQ